MNEPYRIAGNSGQNRFLSLATGFGTSILAGGLFSYILFDLTAPHYLLELLSLVFVEAPFIAFFALLARRHDTVWFSFMALVSLIMAVALSESHLSLTSLIYVKVISTGFIAGRFECFGSTYFRRISAMVAPGFLVALLLGIPILYGTVDAETVEAIRVETLDVYQTFMSEDDALVAVNNAMAFFQSLFSIAIAYLMVFSIIESWMALQLSKWLFRWFNVSQIYTPPFHVFKLPFHAVWLFLVGGLATLSDISVLSPFAINLLTIMSGLYGIQGLAIVTSHSRNTSLGRLPKILFWVIFFLTIGFTGFLLVIAGVLDNWFNLRSIPAASGSEREGNTDENHFTR